MQKGIPAGSWSGIIDLYDWVVKHPEVVPAMDQKPHFDQQARSKIDQDGANNVFYKWFILNYVGQDLNLLRKADPLNRVSASSGPIFIANSSDELVPLSGVYKLQHTFTEKGVPSEVKLNAGIGHEDGYAGQIYQDTVVFLKGYL